MFKAVIFTALICVASVATASEEAYQITSVSGPVSLNMVSAINPGEDLYSESNLSSENGHHFVMELQQKSKIKTVACPVCLRNKVTLKKVAADQTLLDLEHGGLLVRLADPSGKHRLDIKTPTAVASVRGTSFWMHVHHNGQETLSVNNGAVEFRRVGEYPALIQSQEAVDVTPSESSYSRRRLNVFERDTILQVVDSH